MLNEGLDTNAQLNQLGSYDMYKLFIDKFKNTKVFHCNSKIKEIQALIVSHRSNGVVNDQIINLYCELYAVIDRKQVLKKINSV